MGCLHEQHELEVNLTMECAISYHDLTGLGCTVSDLSGKILLESGYGYGSCQVCDVTGRDKAGCSYARAFSDAKVRQFDGRDIYYCPMGLTFFVSPITSPDGSEAKIIAGPFLMTGHEDYGLSAPQGKRRDDHCIADRVLQLQEKIPYVSPAKVASLSAVLSMLAGYVDGISADDLHEAGIGEYAREGAYNAPSPVGEGKAAGYPIKTEKALLSSIAESNKSKAQRCLNELLGYILFSSGRDFTQIRTRIFELLVMISRSAVDTGIPAEETFRINHHFFLRTQATLNTEEMCLLLTEIMAQYIGSLFDRPEQKNSEILQKAMRYIHEQCAKKITLDDVAKAVYLSPSYFSKLFKKELRCNFSAYLNQVRIEKSKQFLLHQNIRMHDVAILVGFDDQSYFTKVFKRVVGVSPSQFRSVKGRI